MRGRGRRRSNGAKFKLRQFTVLALEQWQAALRELAAPSPEDGEVLLPRTVRRANLLVQGVMLPKARGGFVRIGRVKLEVTYPTQPCKRREDTYPGLLRALHPDWRGIASRVLQPAEIRIDDDVEALVLPPVKKLRLTGSYRRPAKCQNCRYSRLAEPISAS